MSLVTWTKADLAAVAPEFGSISDAAFSAFADYAADQINPSVFDASAHRLRLAGIYLTAHLLTISPPSGSTPAGGGGPIASESVGQVSVTYAIAQFAASALNLTRYGIEFRRLAKLGTAGGFVA